MWHYYNARSNRYPGGNVRQRRPLQIGQQSHSVRSCGYLAPQQVRWQSTLSDSHSVLEAANEGS